jgi:hypothetical protein
MNRKHVLVGLAIGCPLALAGAVVGVAFLVVALSRGDDPGGGASKPGRQVVVNGRALGDSQLEELKSRYGRYPAEGRFWYDPRSGLFGHEGRSADGFMYPGHDLGPLDPAASEGKTGVFLNGRELPDEEYMFFSALSGNWIIPGRYWMDGRGDVGYEGSPLPVGNLYQAVRARMSAGGGAPNGRSDNFWWTRFSAGNYNEDNSAGYVSLPGGGFASYGM